MDKEQAKRVRQFMRDSGIKHYIYGIGTLAGAKKAENMALALLPAPKKLKTFTSKPTKNSTKKQKKSCPINGMWKSTRFTSMTEKKEALNFKTWS